MELRSVVRPPRSAGTTGSTSMSLFDNQENRVTKRPKSVHVYTCTDNGKGISIPVKRRALSSKSLNLKAASMTESDPVYAADNVVAPQGKSFDGLVRSTSFIDTVDDSMSEPEEISSSAHTSQKSASATSSDRNPFSEPLHNVTIDTSFVEPDIECFDQRDTGNFCAQDINISCAFSSQPMCTITSDQTATSEYHSEKTGFQHAPLTPQFLENTEESVSRCASTDTIHDEVYRETLDKPVKKRTAIPVADLLVSDVYTEVSQDQDPSSPDKNAIVPDKLLEKEHSNVNVECSEDLEKMPNKNATTNISEHLDIAPHDISTTLSNQSQGDQSDMLYTAGSSSDPSNRSQTEQESEDHLFLTLPVCDSRDLSSSLGTGSSTTTNNPLAMACKAASEPPVSSTLTPDPMTISKLADHVVPHTESVTSSANGSPVLRISKQRFRSKSLHEICSKISSAPFPRRVGLSKRRRVDPLHKRVV